MKMQICWISMYQRMLRDYSLQSLMSMEVHLFTVRKRRISFTV